MTTLISFFFFFNDTATTEIYTLSLHDALPICNKQLREIEQMLKEQPIEQPPQLDPMTGQPMPAPPMSRDRKSTRLNSSHSQISYAVFCLKKKKKKLSTILE